MLLRGPHRAALCTFPHKTSTPCSFLHSSNAFKVLLPEAFTHRPSKSSRKAAKKGTSTAGSAHSLERVDGQQGLSGRIDSRSIAGSGDSLTLGLAAQVRKPPSGGAGFVAFALNPGGSIVGDSRRNTSVFSRCS